jgi:hypothetical protein
MPIFATLSLICEKESRLTKIIKFPNVEALYPKTDLNELVGYKIRVMPYENDETLDVTIQDLDYDEEGDLVYITTNEDFDVAMPLDALLRYHKELRLRLLEDRIKALEAALEMLRN